MTIEEAEVKAKQQLSTIYESREAATITDIFLENILFLSRINRLTKKEADLQQDQITSYTQGLGRLMNHEPVQYVINKAWFYGMELFVDNNVLIPRPETEQLVSWVIDKVKASGKDVFSRGSAESDETQLLKIIDIGTGSGCIALALKKEMPKAEVWACDKSEEALNIARRNGSELNIRVDFQGLDFLNTAQQKQLPTVDIVVSNPPYIPIDNKNAMDKNVVNFEPHLALFVPDEDPLLFYKATAAFGKHRLHTQGQIFMELHEGMGREVAAMFSNQGYSKIEIRNDYQGKDRMICVSI